MNESEAERAFKLWEDSPHGRIPSSAPEAHEAFLAGFEAGFKRGTAEYHDPDCKGCPDCEGVKGPAT